MSACTAGMSTAASGGAAAAITAMLRASTRKSSSSARASAKPRPSSPTCQARASSACDSARRVSRRIISRSRLTCSSMPGRWTLRMTAVPSLRRAACACASDALASGSGSTLLNTSPGSPPSSSLSRAWICGHGAGGTWSCSLASSVVTGRGSRSVRVDSTWPSLTKIGPASSRACRNRRASWPGSARHTAGLASPCRAAIFVSCADRRVFCAIRRSWWLILRHAARRSSRRARWLVRRRSSGVPVQ